MVSSLQSMVLYSMPIVMLFEALKTLWHTPLRSDCLRAFFRRCTHEELRDWAKTLPWDHPIARKLDHEVHRRRMAGECYGFLFFGCGSLGLIPFLIPRRVQGVCVSTHGAVACPPMSLPSTCSTQLGRAVLGASLFVLIFFNRLLGFSGRPTRVPHLPVGCTPHSWQRVQPLRENDGWIDIR